VGFIRKGYKNRGWEFIVVVDLDGMNNKITERAFRSTIEASTQWSGCFANQTKGYYDLFALRCKGWVDRDIFLDLELLKVDTPFEDNYKNSFVGWINRFNHFDRLRVKAVYSKMRKISPQDSWVKVQSAFGGLGVYKPEIFLKYNYDFQNLHIEIYSEHIDLHYQCNLENLDLFINPAMINSHWNLYNLNRIKLIRFLKEFKKYLASTIWKTNFLPKSELQ
jgi:hypothetical protein